ncbi:MAG: hypothetical protein IBJ18_09550 [Phycisphaerales bacterium]|nr:hypothetical protein [Phycisphaerales bacterium]
MRLSSVLPAAIAAALSSVALAQSTYTPLAFGPLGSAPAGTFYTATLDISGDGTFVLATLNNGSQRYLTPAGTLTLSGTGFANALSNDGQTVLGGQSGSNPQRWQYADRAANNIASENITWPGGPVAFGPAYGSNNDASVSALLSPGVSVVGPFGRITAQSAFQAVNINASAGAYRGMAANVPVMGILGSIPGNPTNAYRWNYSTGALTPLTMPGSSTSLSISTGASNLSGDAGVIVGGATTGPLTLPYWWDAAGTPNAIPLLPGAVTMNAITTNVTGTLIGGGGFVAPGVAHGYIYSIADNRLYDMHNVFSAAGILPAGWTLTNVQHISDDGSRIFAQVIDNTGAGRAVLLSGTYSIPTPGALGVLGLAGVLASRRRRA